MKNYIISESEKISLLQYQISQKPNDLSLKSELASLYIAVGDFELASNFLEVVIKEFPDEYLFHHMLGRVYFQSGKKEEALESYKNAINIKKDSFKSYFNIAIYYYEKENYSETISMLEKAMEFSPNWKPSYIQMCFTYYKQNDFLSLKKFITSNIKHLYFSVEAAAISELVAVQENKKSIHPFCPNPMEYISEFHIKDNIKDHDIFIDNLKKEIGAHEFYDGFAPNYGKSQINGEQTTGNIFTREGQLLNKLKMFFINSINDYKEQYKSSENLIFKNFPKDINLWGWSTKFDKGSGHHFSHIHPQGWVSGSFYLNVPNDIESHEANIQFDVQGQLPIFNKETKIEKKNIIPEVGKLLIFPSSLYHSTTPFLSKESYRQSLNFDLVSPHIN